MCMCLAVPVRASNRSISSQETFHGISVDQPSGLAWNSVKSPESSCAVVSRSNSLYQVFWQCWQISRQYLPPMTCPEVAHLPFSFLWKLEQLSCRCFLAL